MKWLFLKSSRKSFEPLLNAGPFSLLFRRQTRKTQPNWSNAWRGMPGGEYWRLRVDFHPRLPRQPFYLGSGTDKPAIEGVDVEHDAAYICEAAKHNGVTALW
jgi:hypothetical protein